MSITAFEISEFTCPECRNHNVEINRGDNVKGGKLTYVLYCKNCGKRSAGYPENLREWKR